MSTHLADSDHSSVNKTKRGPFARYSTIIARILLGLPLVIFGLNGFFNFLPMPEVTLPQRAGEFVGALMSSGYMMPLIGITQLVVGALLLVNRFVPLALALFTPFIVNAVAFHVFLSGEGLGMACVFFALTLYLAWVYRAAYRPLFTARSVLN